ncbi:MAG TPA: MogA/MoaB family molybdenum cofactor biosynthesis protein, partial [Candidatus Udaeobacter sp.]|nr:MogA/MoaB family molybdenum cofactor biosynthesis protein [Candidatus Udaeobacter sp.]
MKVAVLTVSDGVAAGTRVDEGGPAIAALLTGAGHEVVASAVVPDDVVEITRFLLRTSDAGVAELILTTGGTGLGPRDVTPEATRAVLEREAPGIAEALRMESLQHTKMAALGRGVAGVRARTLIVNLPGNPRAIAESLAPLLK